MTLAPSGEPCNSEVDINNFHWVMMGSQAHGKKRKTLMRDVVDENLPSKCPTARSIVDNE